MIDYLEQIFAPEREDAARQGIDRSAVGEGEWPEAAPRTRLAAEEPKRMALPRETGETYWQEEAVRRLESALSDAPAALRRMESVSPVEMRKVKAVREEPETAGSYGAHIRRQEEARADETLERRLRRDSRRYDSGFFWY